MELETQDSIVSGNMEQDDAENIEDAAENIEDSVVVDNVNVVIDTGGLPEEYFQSYEDLDVHRLMLQDTTRTNAYKNAIYNAKKLFEGKSIMDVGAGTGILSLFCAQAGAKRVYAVEASNLALILPKTVAKNGFADIIQVIHSKVEDVKLEEKVDVIVSEWMGFYLLHESMLESVIYARDNFLKLETGLMFPDSAEIFAAPCSLPELWNEKSQYWLDKPYGFDFSEISVIAKLKSKPEIYNVSGDALLSDPQLLWKLSLSTIDTQSLQSFQDRRFFDTGEGEMHGVCLWFVCSFPTVDGGDDDEESTLSTAPWDDETHWKQTVILFPNSVAVEDGDIIGWNFTMEKESLEPGSRSYKLHLEMLEGDDEHPVPCDCSSAKCMIVKHFLSTRQAENENETQEQSSTNME